MVVQARWVPRKAPTTWCLSVRPDLINPRLREHAYASKNLAPINSALTNH